MNAIKRNCSCTLCAKRRVYRFGSAVTLASSYAAYREINLVGVTQGDSSRARLVAPLQIATLRST